MDRFNDAVTSDFYDCPAHQRPTFLDKFHNFADSISDEVDMDRTRRYLRGLRARLLTDMDDLDKSRPSFPTAVPPMPTSANWRPGPSGEASHFEANSFRCTSSVSSEPSSWLDVDGEQYKN